MNTNGTVRLVKAVGKLSIAERDELAKCEAVIKRGVATFVEVGNALLEIRDNKLYRATHTTFEDYCRAKWSITRRRAYQLIDAAGAVSNVNNCSHLPATESQARPLVSLPPEKQREVWEQAVKTAPNGRPTEKHVAGVVREMGLNDSRTPAEHSPEDDDPDNLWHLKRLWRKCKKGERAGFLRWLRESGQLTTQ